MKKALAWLSCFEHQSIVQSDQGSKYGGGKN
jgi:hypothetical protein